MNGQYTIAYLTTAPMHPPAVLRLAQQLGYCGIGIRLAPLVPGGPFSPLVQIPALLQETVSCLAETGVSILDVEGVRLDGQFRPGDFERELEVAGRLGAKALCVIGDDSEERRLVDTFAQLCHAAAPYHLQVALEFMPYSRVRNAQDAVKILREAQCSNGRIAVDFLHVNRSHMAAADLKAIPRECLSYAQVCDAPAEVPTTLEELIHTARYERWLPGTGGIDVRGFAQALPADLPLCLEIPHVKEVARWGAKEWARRVLEATRRVLDR